MAKWTANTDAHYEQIMYPLETQHVFNCVLVTPLWCNSPLSKERPFPSVLQLPVHGFKERLHLHEAKSINFRKYSTETLHYRIKSEKSQGDFKIPLQLEWQNANVIVRKHTNKNKEDDVIPDTFLGSAKRLPTPEPVHQA